MTRVTPTKKELINEETSIVVETIPMVPEADYRALQILYEAISFEADKLRAELVLGRLLKTFLFIFLDTYQAIN